MKPTSVPAIGTAILFLLSAAPMALPVDVGGEAGVVVEAIRTDGETIKGNWSPAPESGHIAVRTAGGVVSLSSEELLAVRFPRGSPWSPPGEWPQALWYQDGSKLPGRILDATATTVTLDTPFGQVTVELANVAAVMWLGPGRSEAAVEQQVAVADRTEDSLMVLHNDRPSQFGGSLESLTAAGGTFRHRDRSLGFSADKTIAVVLAQTQRVQRQAMTCTLGSCCRVAGQLLQATADGIEMQTASGLRLTLPIAAVTEMRFLSGRVTYLSTLAPTASVQRSFLEIPWPARIDASVSNQPMSMNGLRYDRGIGVHAHSELTFELPAAAQALAATIGIDDRTRPGGDVVFKVLAGGREVFNSGPVTGMDPPRDILVELGQATTITLIVEMGRDLDLGDHADWADARLID